MYLNLFRCKKCAEEQFVPEFRLNLAEHSSVQCHWDLQYLIVSYTALYNRQFNSCGVNVCMNPQKTLPCCSLNANNNTSWILHKCEPYQVSYFLTYFFVKTPFFVNRQSELTDRIKYMMRDAFDDSIRISAPGVKKGAFRQFCEEALFSSPSHCPGQWFGLVLRF